MSDAGETRSGHRSRWAPLLPSIPILLVLPVFLHGYSSAAHDGLTHARWYVNFASQFWSGDLWPRWLDGMNFGLGSPTFTFYGPAAYWMSSLLWPLHRFGWDVWHILGLYSGLMILASASGAWVWLRSSSGGRAAAVGALLYCLHPYFVPIDLHVRGALAECTAFLWFPLILLATERITERGRNYLPFLALAFGCLVLTHLPSSAIWAPIPLVYAAVFAPKGRRLRAAALVASALGLGIAASAAYWLPALANQREVSFQAGLWSYPDLDPGRWMILGNRAPRPGFSLLLSITGLSGFALIAVGAFIRRRNASPRDGRLSVFWLALAILAIGLMLPVSAPLWVSSSPLGKIQFPWRLIILLVPAVAAMGALVLRTRPAVSGLREKALWILAGLLLLSWAAPHVYGARRYRYWISPTARRVDVLPCSYDRPEYYPPAAYSFLNGLRTDCESLPEIPRIESSTGSKPPGIVRWEQGRIELRVPAGAPSVVRLRLLYANGWAVRSEPGLPVRLSPDPGTGLMILSLPENDGMALHLEYKPAALRMGKVVSLAGCGIIAALLLLGRKRGREE